MARWTIGILGAWVRTTADTVGTSLSLITITRLCTRSTLPALAGLTCGTISVGCTRKCGGASAADTGFLSKAVCFASAIHTGSTFAHLTVVAVCSLCACWLWNDTSTVLTGLTQLAIAAGLAIYALAAFADLSSGTVGIDSTSNLRTLATEALQRSRTIVGGCASLTTLCFAHLTVGTVGVAVAGFGANPLGTQVACKTFAVLCTSHTLARLAYLPPRAVDGCGALRLDGTSTCLARFTCSTVTIHRTGRTEELFADLTVLTVFCGGALGNDASTTRANLTGATLAVAVARCTLVTFADLAVVAVAVFRTLRGCAASTTLTGFASVAVAVRCAIHTLLRLAHLTACAIHVGCTLALLGAAAVGAGFTLEAIAVCGAVYALERLANLTSRTLGALLALGIDAAAVATDFRGSTVAVGGAVHTLVGLADLTTSTVGAFRTLRLSTATTFADLIGGAVAVEATGHAFVSFAHKTR